MEDSYIVLPTKEKIRIVQAAPIGKELLILGLALDYDVKGYNRKVTDLLTKKIDILLNEIVKIKDKLGFEKIEVWFNTILEKKDIKNIMKTIQNKLKEYKEKHNVSLSIPIS